MESLIKSYSPFFPFVFLLIFFFAFNKFFAIFLRRAGCHLLIETYPDREEKEFLQLKNQTGSLGDDQRMAGFNGILNISTCPSGLRIGATKVFGMSFFQGFFVPWREITIDRKNSWVGEMAALQFGNPLVGKLVITSYLANRLARSAEGHWPESGPFPQATNMELFMTAVKQSIAFFCIYLFIVVVMPLIQGQHQQPSSILSSILIGVVVFGIGIFFKYFNEKAP